MSPEAYRARLAQLGLEAPPDAGQAYGGVPLKPGTPEWLANEVNLEQHRRNLEDRARREEREARRTERQARRAERQREAEIQVGAFDARSASPAQVRERLASIGIIPDPGVHFSDHGRQLDRPPEAHNSGDRASRSAKAHAVVSAALELAARTGQRVDVMRFDELELEAYKAIRGFGGGGYQPAR